MGIGRIHRRAWGARLSGRRPGRRDRRRALIRVFSPRGRGKGLQAPARDPAATRTTLVTLTMPAVFRFSGVSSGW